MYSATENSSKMGSKLWPLDVDCAAHVVNWGWENPGKLLSIIWPVVDFYSMLYILKKRRTFFDKKWKLLHISVGINLNI